MTNYYFLGISLPPLSFENSPEIAFRDFERLLRDNLTQKDYAKTLVIRQLYDMLNLRSFWMHEELDARGTLSAGELEEALLGNAGLPIYVYEFIERYPKVEDRLRHFSFLLSQFFKEAAGETQDFLHNYLSFEREWRLVFAGFRAKKLGRDLSVELQYENPEEELIAQLLAQKDAKTYHPPEKYEALKVIFDKYGDNPLELQKALDDYRYHYIENLLGMTDSFSINRMLAYMAQLIIVENWFDLNKKKGMEIVDTIVKETS